MRATVLGLGEAGRRFATDLAQAGVEVVGYDVRHVAVPPGAEVAETVRDAVAGADLVLSLTTSAGSVAAVRAAAPHLPAAAVYADMNAAGPDRKKEVAAELQQGLFADVAILAPVARAGIATPVMACGPGAARFVELLQPFGAKVDLIDGAPGEATARKLLRSVFMKALATTIIESLSAGRAADCQDWVRGQIEAELTGGGPALLDRLVNGTFEHARRRVHEMEDTRDYLRVLGQPSEMTEASLSWLSAIDAGTRSRPK